jgi:hypothetical protein
VKEISEEYEREVERRGKGEIVKRKVDKILFVCLLEIEFMLMKEKDKKKKFVKNNLLPVLPFLLSGEEKEREEKDSNGEDVKNAIVFQFLSEELLFCSSFRCLSLSDERKLLLNKALLFSSRKDIPFTRRESLNVLWSLFYHGREDEIQLVIREGGTKCVVLKMTEKEEREEKVKENGKYALRYCLCQEPDRDRIPSRRKQGWKRKEIMREMMWMMEEEDVKEALIMSSLHGIKFDYVPSFTYGLGMCLRVHLDKF